MEFEALYQAALAVTAPRKLSAYAEAGAVGAAILTKAGHVYTGVCIDSALFGGLLRGTRRSSGDADRR